MLGWHKLAAQRHPERNLSCRIRWRRQGSKGECPDTMKIGRRPLAAVAALSAVATAIVTASTFMPAAASSNSVGHLARAQNAKPPSKSLFFGSGPVWSPNKEYAVTYVDGDIAVYVKSSGQFIDYSANAVLANLNLAGNGEVAWAVPDRLILDTTGGWVSVNPLTGDETRLSKFNPFTSRLYSIDPTGRFYIFGVGGQTTNVAPKVIPPLRIYSYDQASGTATLLLIVPKPSGDSVSVSWHGGQPFVTVGR